MKRAELLQRALPFLKFAAVVAGAAAAVVTVGLLAAPVISNRLSRDESALVREAADGLEPGRRYAAFPLSLPRPDFAERILARCPGGSERRAIGGYYEDGPDGTVNLKKGLTENDRNSLSLLLESIGYENEGAVHAYRPAANAGSLAGYVLELQGRGFGGPLRILACVGLDGTIRKVTLAEPEGIGTRRMNENARSLLPLFTGTKGALVPVTAGMLPGIAVDAVSGATATFSGLGTALREGSLFVMRIGGGS